MPKLKESQKKLKEYMGMYKVDGKTIDPAIEALMETQEIGDMINKHYQDKMEEIEL